MKTNLFKPNPTLFKAKARRIKTKFGFKTEIYSRTGFLLYTFPESQTQPHANLKYITLNCFQYLIEFENIKPY